jgi:hypothetical protein
MKAKTAIRLALACLVLCAVAAAIVVFVRRPAEQPLASGHDVPLGVEEAVIIRYGGPRLVARPYRRGASVNVRIADEVQAGAMRVYDVRYVVNLPGEFVLTEYLMSVDGRPIDDLPAFRVRGLTSLTKDIETRIREIEAVGVHIWHWYYETLVGLGIAWVLWLVGLILVGRPKRPPAPEPLPPEPSLVDQIVRFLQALSQGKLSVDEQARLELLLLRHWRERLSLQQRRMRAACLEMRRDGTVGQAYQALQDWLHNPASVQNQEEMAGILRAGILRTGQGRL